MRRAIAMLVLLSGCWAPARGGAGPEVKSFQKERIRFEQALRRDDPDTIYEQLDDEQKRRFGSRERFRQWWKENRDVVRDGARGTTEVLAVLTLEDGQKATLKWKDGRWVVVSAPELATGARSPARLLEDLISYMERMYTPEYLHLLSPPTREHLLAVQRRRIAALRSVLFSLKKRRIDPDEDELVLEAGRTVRVSIRMVRMEGKWYIHSIEFREAGPISR